MSILFTIFILDVNSFNETYFSELCLCPEYSEDVESNLYYYEWRYFISSITMDILEECHFHRQSIMKNAPVAVMFVIYKLSVNV